MTDLEILKLIQQNKLEKPIKELYKHFPYVRSILFKNGAKEINVQEIFNDALVLLIEKSGKKEFQLSSKFSTYLTGIAINLHRNQMRKDNRTDSIISIGDFEATDGLDDIEFDFEKEEKLKVLDKVLDSITEKCKQILRLFYFEKCSMQEIAEAQGYSSVQSAKTQKYKCLESAHVLAKELIVKSEKTVL